MLRLRLPYTHAYGNVLMYVHISGLVKSFSYCLSFDRIISSEKLELFRAIMRLKNGVQGQLQKIINDVESARNCQRMCNTKLVQTFQRR